MSRSASNQAVANQKFLDEMEKFLWRSLVDNAIDTKNEARLLDYALNPYIATSKDSSPTCNLLPAGSKSTP